MNETNEYNQTAIKTPDQIVDDIAAALDNGNRLDADTLSSSLWSKGGELSSESKNLYIECLLDMGEIERAALLLKPILQEIDNYINEYWQVLLKYGFLSGDLALALSLGEYPDIYPQMEAIFEWLKYHQQNDDLEYFDYMLRQATDATRGKLCAFDLLVLEDGTVECVFYSTDNDEQNRQTAAEINEKATDYLDNLEMALPEDWILAFDNIANRDLS